MIAKTAASGGSSLLPEVLAFTSSLELDRALLREDLVGSLAHLTMLSRTGIIPKDAAARLKGGLVSLWEEAARGELQLADEEDVHMAVEAALTASLGEVGGLLHSARSRNDQVALDLRLHAREVAARALEGLSAWLQALAARAEEELSTLLPSYTHRQRAQPISLGYWLCGVGAMFARDVEALGFVLGQADVLPLGVGAIAGTSLPIDREVTRGLLAFSQLTTNGLDTVGDRDFALDLSYACARLMLHASRFAADVVDFASPEFGFVKLDGEIACGSSMMPQKRNPDVFELLRGKSGQAVGNLVSLLVTLKGLPGGYNRDLQEDRAPLLATGRLLLSVLEILPLALSRITFDRARCRSALESDFTQATDLAEGLVQKGVPFRVAYQAVGGLVRECQERKLPLSQATPELGKRHHPLLDEEVLERVRLEESVASKKNAGGTSPSSVRAQLQALNESARKARAMSKAVPRLDELFRSLKETSL